MQGTKSPVEAKRRSPTLKISVAHTLGQGAASTWLAYGMSALQAQCSAKHAAFHALERFPKRASFNPMIRRTRGGEGGMRG
jgi:hypothetical protein